LADPSAILSCLRVSRRFHALAYQHIDVLYRHVFVDRDTVKSVFQGIEWARLEEQWTVAPRRSRSYDGYSDDDNELDSLDNDQGIGLSEHCSSPSDSSQEPGWSSSSTSTWDLDIRRLRNLGRRFVPDYSDLENSGEEGDGERTFYYLADESDCGDGEERHSYGGSIWSEGGSGVGDEEWDWSVSDFMSPSRVIEVGEAENEQGGKRNHCWTEEGDDWDALAGVASRKRRRRWSRDESDPNREWSEGSEGDSESSRSNWDITKSSANSRSPSLDHTSSEDECDREPLHSKAQTVPLIDAIPRVDEPGLRRPSLPISPGSSLFPWDYEYSSDGDAQHTRKSYALSKCQVLTLSDRWSRTDLRDHSHNILHNGKAHQLLAAVTTLRILPPPDSTNNIDNDGITALCEQEGHCRFVRELSPRKIVHRNLGDAVAELQWEKAVDELVLFLPFAGWTDPTHYPEYSTEYGIACSRTKASTIVLGPGIKKGSQTRRPVSGHREW